MSDIDYAALFQNGQLVHEVPEHKEILDRMYQQFKGYPEESIFKSKYKGYLEKYHSEDLVPAVAPVTPPEPSVPVDEPAPAEPVVLAEPPKPEALPEDEAPVPAEEEKPKKGKRGRGLLSPK